MRWAIKCQAITLKYDYVQWSWFIIDHVRPLQTYSESILFDFVTRCIASRNRTSSYLHHHHNSHHFCRRWRLHCYCCSLLWSLYYSSSYVYAGQYRRYRKMKAAVDLAAAAPVVWAMPKTTNFSLDRILTSCCLVVPDHDLSHWFTGTISVNASQSTFPDWCSRPSCVPFINSQTRCLATLPKEYGKCFHIFFSPHFISLLDLVSFSSPTEFFFFIHSAIASCPIDVDLIKFSWLVYHFVHIATMANENGMHDPQSC